MYFIIYKLILVQTVLCAIAEIVSMRFVNGVGQRTGLMGIDYSTAQWLYKYVIYSKSAISYLRMSAHFIAS